MSNERPQYYGKQQYDNHPKMLAIKALEEGKRSAYDVLIVLYGLLLLIVLLALFKKIRRARKERRRKVYDKC